MPRHAKQKQGIGLLWRRPTEVQPRHLMVGGEIEKGVPQAFWLWRIALILDCLRDG
jgi:hypothetical protein